MSPVNPSAGSANPTRRDVLRAGVVGLSLPPHLLPGQGLIWYRVSQSGERLLGHNGGDFGVSTQMFFRPRDGAGVIVLQNADAYRPMIRIQTRLWEEADGL